MSLGEVYIVMFYGCPEHSVKFITIAAVGKIDHIFFQIFALKKTTLVIQIIHVCWSIIERQNCCDNTT